VNEKLSIEVLDDWERFGLLESEWNQLLRASSADIIFLTWEFLSTWVAVNRRSVQPFIIVVRNMKKELVGVAPFYQSEYCFMKTVPYRTLRIISDYASGAECLNWLARREIESGVYKAIFSALEETSDVWDCFWMPYVPSWTGGCERILDGCRDQKFYCHTRSAELAYTVLPKDFGTFIKSLSKSRQTKLRQQNRSIWKDDRFSISRCQSVKELGRYIEAFFDLHARRWETRGEKGTFHRKPGEEVFYRKFLPVALRNGWLRLYGLSVAGEFKAIQVGYVYNNIFYALQEGFDPDYLGGAGNVLRSKVIEECIQGGIEIYDFLGEMTQHKRRWLAQQRNGCDILIGNRNIKNKFLFFQEIWPTGRYFRPSLLPSASKSRRSTCLLRGAPPSPCAQSSLTNG
jgi:hypothetical protein